MAPAGDVRYESERKGLIRHAIPGSLMLRRVLVLTGLAAMIAACGDDATSDDGGATADTGATETDAGGESDAAAIDTGDDATEDAGPTVTAPDPQPYSEGECPTLTDGTNDIRSAGMDRQVVVYLPAEPEGAGLAFLWHGLGDSTSNFARAFGAQTMADTYDVIVVLPRITGNYAFGWPFLSSDDATPDLTLFDDVVACADATWDIDNTRVFTTGFSAGALMSTRLLLDRSEYLASVVTFSGGTGVPLREDLDPIITGYKTPASTIPVLAIHGGETDSVTAVAAFMEMTLDMNDHLREDGHLVIECDHGRGHTVPFDPYAWALPFLFSHVIGVESPYVGDPLDSPWPSYCEMLD